MISNNIQGEKYLRFISLLSKFPKLFINDYSQVSVSIAQKLQRLRIVQKEDLIKKFKALM